MKKLSVLSLTFALSFSDIYVEGFLYKDPRIMGAGGANTALGGYSTSLFYNPAGLINIKKSHGIEVELLGLSLSGSKNVKSLIDDIQNADTNDTQEITDIVSKYSGEGLSVNVSNYTSLSYHTQSDSAFSIGALVSADTILVPHANDGSNGLLETHARGYGGIVAAYATDIDSSFGKFTLGIGGKYIYQKSYDVGLGAGELVNNQDNLGDYIQNYEKTNSGFGIDVGILYRLPVFESWNPTFGASVMNIGTLEFEGSYGSQPMSVNLGFSITKDLPIFDRLRIAVDYIDLLNSNKVLVGDVEDGNGKYKSYKYIDAPYDISRHLRGGVTLDIIDNSIFMASVSGGWYQGSYTLGADLQLAVIKLQASTYEEQLGGSTSGSEISDRRYVVMLGIGW